MKNIYGFREPGDDDTDTQPEPRGRYCPTCGRLIAMRCDTCPGCGEEFDYTDVSTTKPDLNKMGNFEAMLLIVVGTLVAGIGMLVAWIWKTWFAGNGKSGQGTDGKPS